MHQIIDFRARNVHFYLDLKERFTKIADDSGVGKTYFCEALRASIDTYADVGIYPVKDKDTGNHIPVKFISGVESDEKSDLSAEGILFILDEADLYLLNHHEVIEEILNNRTSYFLFMLRAEIPGLSFGYAERAYFICDADKREICIKYYD